MRKLIALAGLGAALLATPALGGALSGNCRLGDQPAASLLIPFFEVDLQDPNGKTTLFSVNNGSSKAALARVVLWTDWAVPTLAFDLYLTGYDVQTVNVRDLLRGLVPHTGSGVSPQGALSTPGTGFDGCAGTAAGGAPLSSDDVALLVAAHTGRPMPKSLPAQCLGSPRADTRFATGYVTVDAVRRCSPVGVASPRNTPADSLYFAAGGTGIATNDNVLWGDYVLVDPAGNSSQGNSAVHLVADADALVAGSYTFYGRFSSFDGRDARVPLSSLYYSRFVHGGAFDGGTRLIVWRDTRDPSPRPIACGGAPGWLPLGVHQLVAFDESENATEIAGGAALPIAAQAVQVGSAQLPVDDDYGWLLLDLWHADETHAQAWVGPVFTAMGRFSAGYAAIAADDLCNWGP
ncbi:MAG TPA: hypothetical protein VF121_00900 [Thermoanaerobaculia bacterium]|nr:hypothetical protein [Thermoanaerobaculia bacterium]